MIYVDLYVYNVDLGHYNFVPGLFKVIIQQNIEGFNIEGVNIKLFNPQLVSLTYF